MRNHRNALDFFDGGGHRFQRLAGGAFLLVLGVPGRVDFAYRVVFKFLSGAFYVVILHHQVRRPFFVNSLDSIASQST
ncbi:hypothetical protein SDC9_173617 [bioreactor metagenome]|uniref:Uncharacterized protein n=1 Tax=bioreactor metagenome TaxID=1076179 RepID=A0A645GR84_9ZZZZ